MTQDDSPRNVSEIVRFYDFELNSEEAATFGVTKGLDGCVRSYHGLEIDRERCGVWVQEWLSLAHHTAFQNSPEYPAFVARVASFASTKRIDIQHVQFQPYPAVHAFTAPLTEVTVATRKSSSDAFEDVIKESIASFDTLSYGPILADPTHKQYLIVNGWQSIEQFRTALSGSLLYQKLQEVAKLSSSIYELTG